jgi:hypothetical protein
MTVVVDLRSMAYSRYTPHFTGENLEGALTGRNMRYAFA